MTSDCYKLKMNFKLLEERLLGFSLRITMATDVSLTGLLGSDAPTATYCTLTTTRVLYCAAAAHFQMQCDVRGVHALDVYRGCLEPQRR